MVNYELMMANDNGERSTNNHYLDGGRCFFSRANCFFLHRDDE